jgi:hypothetical protein
MSVQVPLWLLVALLATILFRAVARPQPVYEYPYFMAAVFAAFILPQAISLARFSGGVPETWVAKVILMAVFCLLACCIGYLLPPMRSIRRLSSLSLDDRRLLHGAMVFLFVAYARDWKIGAMTDEDRGGSQWTGPATICLFLRLDLSCARHHADLRPYQKLKARLGFDQYF